MVRISSGKANTESRLTFNYSDFIGHSIHPGSDFRRVFGGDISPLHVMSQRCFELRFFDGGYDVGRDHGGAKVRTSLLWVKP
jgi:hypothetical protein